MSQTGMSSDPLNGPVLATYGVAPKYLQPFRQQTGGARWPYGSGWLNARSAENPEPPRSRERNGSKPQPPHFDTAAMSIGDDAGRDPSDECAKLPQAALTALESVLALSCQLAENIDERLAPRQVDYAQTIYASALELRSLLEGIRIPEKAQEHACGHLRDTAALLQGVLTKAQDNMPHMPPPMPTHAHDIAGASHELGQTACGGERVAILEGDDRLAALMLERVRRNGYQAFVVPRLAALREVVRQSPPDAIVLGRRLGDTDGWRALDVLRHDPATRLIPLCMVAVEGAACRWLELGNCCAPEQESRRCRYGVEDACKGPEVGAQDDPVGCAPLQGMFSLESMQKLMSSPAPSTPSAPSAAAAAIAALAPDTTRYLSIGYGDGTSDAAILKQGATLEALLDGAVLFLHQAVNAVNDFPSSLQDDDRAGAASSLAGGKVLLVDDDIRHIYTITGAFEDCGMTVFHAEDADEALAALQREPGIDAVLLNVVMDGLDAEGLLRRIRDLEAFRTIPIIALTGAADCADPCGSRARWLRAGASDDIARPANIEQLLSLLRVHLSMRR